jgi:hypothetical protein
MPLSSLKFLQCGKSFVPRFFGDHNRFSSSLVAHGRIHPERPLQKLLRDFPDCAAFAAGTVHHSNGNVLGDIAAPAFGGVEGDPWTVPSDTARSAVLTRCLPAQDRRWLRTFF